MNNKQKLELTNFEKTLWFYFSSQRDDLVLMPKEELWNDFFSFYGLDINLKDTIVNLDKTIKVALDIEKARLYDWEAPEILFKNFYDTLSDTEYNEIYLPLLKEFKIIREKGIRDNYVLNTLFYQLLARKDLEKVDFSNSEEAFERNKNVYRELYDWLNLCHSNVSAWNAHDTGKLDDFSTPLANSLSNIKAIYTILLHIKIEGYEHYSDVLELYYEALNYEIKGYIDTVWLFMSLQLVIASPFYSHNERKFASDLIDMFRGILKEAKILRILKNDLFFNEDIPAELRKSKDRTTRFQILFEYTNGDQYSLRLDLAHMGVDNFHLNMTSKGKIDSFPLSKNQFLSFVKENEIYEEWFITYNNNYYYLRDKKRKIFRESSPKHEKLLKQLKFNEHYIMENFGQEKVAISVLESWKRVFNSSSYLMPSGKINPYPYYEESIIMEWINQYISRRLTRPDKYIDLKDEILQNIVRWGLFSTSSLEDYKESSVPELLYLALHTLKEKKIKE